MGKLTSTRPRRRSFRLPDYDYSQAGGYFVTICSQARKCCFGDIVAGTMALNHAGQIIPPVWEGLAARFPGVTLDAYVIMPNHLHGIILLGAAGNPGQSINSPPTLGQIIRSCKAVSTRLIRKLQPDFAWQRNYYEHVIRDDRSLDRVREYIANNPLRWELDRENPEAKGKDDFDRWLATLSGPPKPDE